MLGETVKFINKNLHRPGLRAQLGLIKAIY